RDAGDDLRAVFLHLPGVEAAGRAGHALDDESRLFSHQDAHLQRSSQHGLCGARLSAAVAQAFPTGGGARRPCCSSLHFASSTIFVAPSAMSAAGTTLSPLSASIRLPSSTLVPSRRTTSGTLRPTSFTAVMTPAAMVSQRMMPPKMLTKMPRTLG